MSKFKGYVGYFDTVETVPGHFEERTLKRLYRGDVLEERRSYARQESVNGTFTVSDRISIVADRYAFDHLADIVYVEHLGRKWEVSSVDRQSPRLILHLGGLYHENIGEEDVTNE